jgi:hypothetical protein
MDAGSCEFSDGTFKHLVGRHSLNFPGTVFSKSPCGLIKPKSFNFRC